MFRYVLAICVITAASLHELCTVAHAGAAEADHCILRSTDATPIEQLAAKEVRRYVYLRTGTLLSIEQGSEQPSASGVIIVGNKNRPEIEARLADVDVELKKVIHELAPEQYVIKTIQRNDRTFVLLVGGNDIGTLYAAYRFAEHLGIRFYLHGDVIPDQQVALSLPELDDVARPLFHRRGIQPFHDFPEGPDWWDVDAFRAVLGQLPKLRMNFFGLHTYPEGGVGPEPTVWIGPPDDIGPGGNVKTSYPARHFATSNVTAAWGYQPQKTSNYTFGAASMFTRDDYGADYMRDTSPWNEMTPEQSNQLFNRYGKVVRESFTFARHLGIKTSVGTETPLVIPEQVRQRLAEAGKDPDDPQTVQELYEGIFRRIKSTYPIDYYWLWTPEGWTWDKVSQETIDKTLADFKAVQKAAEAVQVPFQLATCGWVLGPPQDPTLFDTALPKDWPLSCINRNVGHDPVEPGFKNVSGRPQWAIPWLEDDPAMILPQLWVGRMRKDAADALRYGCDGLLGIHWRTRILAPNVAALARAAWSQDGWKTPAVDRDPAPPEGSFDDRRTNYRPGRAAPCDDFYKDWAATQFGSRAGVAAAALFARLDCRLPRPSTWVNGPGGIVADGRPWSQVSKEYGFVKEFSDLEPLVRGAGNKERFQYWLANFRYLRAIGKLNCTWAQLNREIETMQKTEGAVEKQKLARRKVLPFRVRLIRELSYVQEYLMNSVTTLGAMGTVANWQQHVIPILLDPSEKAIKETLGEDLPLNAYPPRKYSGDARAFVPVIRTLLEPGEPLRVDMVILGARPITARFYWRPLGAGKFKSFSLVHVARGVYRAELPKEQVKQDFEYFINVKTKSSGQMRFPASAPTLNQSVVVAQISTNN